MRAVAGAPNGAEVFLVLGEWLVAEAIVKAIPFDKQPTCL